MPWTLKRWWKWIAIAAAALLLLSLIISPNPLSFLLIPPGMGLLGLAGPSVLWGLQKVADTTKEPMSRLFGVFLTLFAFGIAKLGFDLAWAGVAVSIAIWSQKLSN